MNIKEIKKIIELVKDEGVSEFKYEDKDFKISVNLNSTSNAGCITSLNTLLPQAVSNETGPSVNEVSVEDVGIHSVSSPFVGTYYSQPSPGKPAYVKVGDRVSKGQTLCILEAMKIMNEIESDVSGEIIEVCCNDEALVEFGQPLFKVRT